jgi:type II secretory pathway predicted ATPase ExeA
MTIDRLRAHWGFSRMPFGKDLAPSMLHLHRSHAEAAARITWCIDERVMGVITGEVGAGKTVAVRGALAGIDASRHTVIYLGNPTVGARGLYASIVSTLGGTPRFHRASLIPQAQDALATEEHERGRRVVLVLDLCRPHNYADAASSPERGRLSPAGSASSRRIWLSA